MTNQFAKSLVWLFQNHKIKLSLSEISCNKTIDNEVIPMTNNKFLQCLEYIMTVKVFSN